MLNPYAEVDWKNALRVTSATHMHLTSQEHLDNAFLHGIRHFAISNYYPSVPTRPDTHLSDHRLRHDWPIWRYGEPVELPINWNDVIDWRGELADDVSAQLPFEEADTMFTNVPPDTVWSPNGIALDEPAAIRFITQDGCALSAEGTHAVYPLASRGMSPQELYVRIEVSHGSGERLFLQAIILQHAPGL